MDISVFFPSEIRILQCLVPTRCMWYIFTKPEEMEGLFDLSRKPELGTWNWRRLTGLNRFQSERRCLFRLRCRQQIVEAHCGKVLMVFDLGIGCYAHIEAAQMDGPRIPNALPTSTLCLVPHPTSTSIRVLCNLRRFVNETRHFTSLSCTCCTENIENILLFIYQHKN